MSTHTCPPIETPAVGSAVKNNAMKWGPHRGRSVQTRIVPSSPGIVPQPWVNMGQNARMMGDVTSSSGGTDCSP
ncbi:hypothetical protein ACOMHN_008231 [Nucella lapillus]